MQGSKPKIAIAGVRILQGDIGLPRSWLDLAAGADKLDARLTAAFGPFDCIERARSALLGVEHNSFGIRLGNQHPGSYRKNLAHGARRTLKCNALGCTYSVTYELTRDDGAYGWYMYSSNTKHNDHPIAKMIEAKPAPPVDSQIPDKYMCYLTSGLKSGLNARQIYLFLNHMASHDNDEVRWTLSNVEDLCRNSESPLVTQSLSMDHDVKKNESDCHNSVVSAMSSKATYTTSDSDAEARMQRRVTVEKELDPIIEYATASDENMARFRENLVEFSRIFDNMPDVPLPHAQQQSQSAAIVSDKKRKTKMSGREDVAIYKRTLIA